MVPLFFGSYVWGDILPKSISLIVYDSATGLRAWPPGITWFDWSNIFIENKRCFQFQNDQIIDMKTRWTIILRIPDKFFNFHILKIYNTLVIPRLLGWWRPKIIKNRGIANFRFTKSNKLISIIVIIIKEPHLDKRMKKLSSDYSEKQHCLRIL